MTPRKQTQLADREAAILKIVGDILHQEGPDALTMERVLAHVNFSKGTLYNHFSCREDLIVAFHAQCFAEHLEYFARGALFHGRPRERFVAAGLGHQLKKKLDPRPFRLALTENILSAASERWRDAFLYFHHEAMGVFLGLVRDGIASGDLPADVDPELVAGAAWAVCVGADELHQSGMIFRHRPAAEYEQLQSRMVAAVLDGFGWQPFSSGHDYVAVRQRALTEVYASEARELGLLGRRGSERAVTAAAR